MRKMVTFLLATFMIFSLAACGSNNYTKNRPTENNSSALSPSIENPTESESVISSEQTSESVKSSDTLVTKEYKGITFKIPENWEESIIDDNAYYYMNGLSDTSEFIMVSFSSIDELTLDDVRDNDKRKILLDAVIDGLKSGDGVDLFSSYDADVDGVESRMASYTMEVDGENYLIISYVIPDANGFYTFSYLFKQNHQEHSDEIDAVVDSISLPEATKAVSISESEDTPEVDDESDADTSRPKDSELLSSERSSALSKANDYLAYTAFSHDSLVEQLEYEGYSHDDAVYAADNCGADWSEQALKKADEYLSSTSFSYTGLVEQLEFEKFSHDDAVYAADNCDADWNEQAAKKAEDYRGLRSFSHNELVDQLEYEGFTSEQAEYGASATE